MGEIMRNCRLCAKPMESSPFMMCVTCLRDSEKVKNLIAKHPYVSVEQIARETNVSLEKIDKMVELGLKNKSAGADPSYSETNGV